MRGIQEIRCIGLQGRKTGTYTPNQIFPVYLKHYILTVTLNRMLSGFEFQAIPFDCRMLLLESSAGYPGANRRPLGAICRAVKVSLRQRPDFC